MNAIRTIAFSCLLLLPNSLRAWSECGHHIIAVMAFKSLAPERQQELLRILKAHPRFAEDFKTPNGIKNEEHWLIGRAGYWPDIVRKGTGKAFDRPKWHYELGPTHVIGAVEKVPAFPGPLPTDASLDTEELHIAQAVVLCQKVLADTKQADSNRAIALCWLLHLVADAHQPCHAGALYVEGIFPEGDRGANSIKTKQSGNLHALWDGLLGRSFSESDVNRRMKEIEGVAFVMNSYQAQSIQGWLDESRREAMRFVYDSEVLDHISVAARSKSTEIDTLDLSSTYLRGAGRMAQVRAKLAAARLGKLLQLAR